MWSLSALVLLLPVVNAAQAPKFSPPCPSVYAECPHWGDFSNGSLPRPQDVPGKVFNHFAQIWFENTAFATTATTAYFQKLAKEGILLTNYRGVTHPSEPNYLAAVVGDFFGMHDDEEYNVPSTVASIVDLLEEHRPSIGWASYQENMHSDGSEAFTEDSPDYQNSSAPPYTYWQRKHNGFIITNTVAAVPERRLLNRNLNDFVVDLKADRLPPYIFVTPNMNNDAHDTNVQYGADWLQFFLGPLLEDKRFNREKTLIVVTFDEDDSAPGNDNTVYTLLLGSAIPQHLRGTKDDTFYTHYSALSTVQSNWGLGCLGRGDTNKTMSNVFDFVTKSTGYKNMKVTHPPMTNISGPIPGPLNPNAFQPYRLPDLKAKCAGGGRVFIPKGLNLTPGPLPPPVDLTKLNKTVPDAGPRVTTTARPTPTPKGHNPPGHNHDHDHGHY